MKQEKRKVMIFILGQRFSIVTNEDEQYIDELVKKIEAKVREIQRAYSFLSSEGAALLAALDYCDEKQKLKIDMENLRLQIKDYIKESGHLRSENEKLSAENESLYKELASLKTEINKLKSANASKISYPKQNEKNSNKYNKKN